MFGFECLAGIAAQAQFMNDLRQSEDARLKSLSPDELDRELKIRSVRALEEIARKNPTINIRSSIF